MKFIAHRGNLHGSGNLENHPKQIDKCLNKSLDCEIDLWVIRGKYYLGHDEPQYLISKFWLIDRQTHLWIHCKNKEALETLQNLIDVSLNYFWHESDSYTMTSKRFVWIFPGENVVNNGIAVLPETWNYKDRKSEMQIAYAICTDFVEYFMNEFQ